MRFLILDIGAGTIDVLYYNSETGTHYKAVSKSPVLSIAEKATQLRGKILITGTEMGGGAISRVLKERAKDGDVFMTKSAAATIHHSMERVESFGIKIISDDEAEDLKRTRTVSCLETGDLDFENINHIVKGMAVDFSFDVVGICAQDHGTAPDGVSHLDYRHNMFKTHFDEEPLPHTMLYKADEVPSTMSRLSSISRSARALKAGEIYVMDSGIAAISGASLDPVCRGKEKIITLDIATSHTVGAVLEKGEIAGFFEYHTSDITLDRLESLIVGLAEGKLEHKKILNEGGHGAYIRKVLGFESVEIMIATGPKRALIEGSKLPFLLGAPLGDNMMTGTAGVLEAIRRLKGLEPFDY